MDPIDIGTRRKRRQQTERHEIVVEHIAEPTAEQQGTWDAFWHNLIADLEPIVMQRIQALPEAA